MARRKPGSESAGYHYDATPKHPRPTRTPTVAPSPSQAATAPAGDYAGAGEAYTKAVQALPAPAQAVTETATKRASRARERRLTRAKLQSRQNTARRRRNSTRAEKRVQRTEKTIKATRYTPKVTPGMQKQAAVKISTTPNLAAEPPSFKGKPTAGTPTRRELQRAARAGTLKVNKKGFATTPQVRLAAGKVKQARKAVRKSGPSLAGLSSSEEKRAAKLDVRIGPKYGIPPSVLMAQQRQESGFNPAAVSSAGAQGISQFIPSTAASYGVEYGTGQPEVKSQIRGQAKLLADSGFATDPKGAMTAYTGGYSDAEYNNPVLEGAADYKALDKRGNPKARRQLAKAQAKAQKLGLRIGKRKAAGKPSGPSRIPSVVYIGKQAEKKFGLSVGENPAFGGVAPVHVTDSYHYRTDSKGRGEAIDVSGDAEKMMAFDHWVARKWGKGVTELFYDPGISIKEGSEIGAIGGHEDHVHVAVAMPGEHIAGGVATGPAAGPGGAVFVGYGSSAPAAEASSARARKAAAKGKGRTHSPMERYWNISHRLKSVGVGRRVALKDTSSPTLKALEEKYGAKAA